MGLEPKTTQDAPDGHPRRWRILAVALVGPLMGNIDQYVVATALPTLRSEFHTSIALAALSVTVYQLGLIASMPIVGRLSDQLGRKRVHLIAIGVFAVASLACGLSDSIGMLIAFRVVQAIGAGGLMPTATGIVAESFGRDRDRGIGLIASVVSIGALVGPVLGGVIIHYWSWRGVFLINLPVAAVILPLAARVIPRSRPRATATLDVPGIALLVAALSCFMVGTTLLGQGASPLSVWFIGSEAAAVLFGFLLVRHCLHVPHPIIPVHLLRVGAFFRMNVLNFIYGAAVLGMGSLIPLYVQERYSFSPLAAGSVLSVRAIGVITISILATFLLRRFGYRRPMLIGFGLQAIGLALIGWGAPEGITPYLWLAACGGILGIGAGAAIPATNNALLSFSPTDVSTISGLRGMFKQIGALVAISIVTAVPTRSGHAGLVLGDAMLVMAAALTLLVLPLILSVPDRAR